MYGLDQEPSKRQVGTTAMPAAHPESLREEVKVLYVSGLPPKQIANRFSQIALKADTVSVWAKRGGWVSMRDKLAESVQRAIVETAKNGLEEQSNSTRKALANELEQSIAALSKTKTRATLDHAVPRSKALASYAETASKVFGWNQQTNSAQFGVLLLSSPELDPRPVAQEPIKIEPDLPQNT